MIAILSSYRANTVLIDSMPAQPSIGNQAQAGLGAIFVASLLACTRSIENNVLYNYARLHCNDIQI